MKKVALLMLVVATVACGEDEGSSNNSANNANNTSTNNATNNTSTNNATNNTSTNNATNNTSTNNANNTSTNNAANNTTTNNTTNNTPLPDPYTAQVTFRRVATENCVLSGCIKSETVNFVSGVIYNQDGRRVVLDTNDGDYQALDVEAQRESFRAAMEGGFGCPEMASEDGTTYEFEASIRRAGRSSQKIADITGCVVAMEEGAPKLVIDIMSRLKATYLP